MFHIMGNFNNLVMQFISLRFRSFIYSDSAFCVAVVTIPPIAFAILVHGNFQGKMAKACRLILHRVYLSYHDSLLRISSAHLCRRPKCGRRSAHANPCIYDWELDVGREPVQSRIPFPLSKAGSTASLQRH